VFLMAKNNVFWGIALCVFCAGIWQSMGAMQQLVGSAGSVQAAGVCVEQEATLSRLQQAVQEKAATVLCACSPSIVGDDPANLVKVEKKLKLTGDFTQQVVAYFLVA
jgi:hypothetical protein